MLIMTTSDSSTNNNIKNISSLPNIFIPQKINLNVANNNNTSDVEQLPKEQKSTSPTTFNQSRHSDDQGSIKVDKRIQVEPNVLQFELTHSTPSNARQKVTIRNLGPRPLFFRTKTNNLEEIRPEPHMAFIDGFSSGCFAIWVTNAKASPKITTPGKKCKHPDRLTIEYVRLNRTAKSTAAAEHLNTLLATNKSSRLKFPITITYTLATELQPVTPEEAKSVRNAFFGTQTNTILKGDFEKEIVKAQTTITNNADHQILWNLNGPSPKNDLIMIEPRNGLLKPYQSESITLSSKSFRVGHIEGIKEHLQLEWTFAHDSLTKFDVSVFRHIKVYRLPLVIVYSYEPIKDN